MCNVRMKKIKSQQVVIYVYQKKKKNHMKNLFSFKPLERFLLHCNDVFWG